MSLNDLDLVDPDLEKKTRNNRPNKTLSREKNRYWYRSGSVMTDVAVPVFIITAEHTSESSQVSLCYWRMSQQFQEFAWSLLEFQFFHPAQPS